MGGICSKGSSKVENPYAGNGHVDRYKSDKGGYQSNVKTIVTPPPVIGIKEDKLQEQKQQLQDPVGLQKTDAAPDDDFYDGIPRYPRAQKSRSVRSTQAAVAKVSEVSSRLGRAGTAGLGKAVEVLDTLGSSMTNLNSGAGFAATAPSKGNEVSILAFEVANTIVKGSNLMQSLSKRSIRQLKEEVLPSKGVQHLISKDTDELLRIVAADKREELKIFSGEVVRFGNRSKDPQWHNLDRYLEKISRGLGSEKNLKEEADLVIQQLMNLVHLTAELYHELHALDRFELDYQRKRLEEEMSISTQKGDNMSLLRSELKSQKKIVRNLKKKSLWSKSLEEVMEKFVDIVHFLHLEIQNVFGGADEHIPAAEETPSSRKKLGPAGLALHYANIIIQIDTLVARSSSMPPNTRDSLYQSLPPTLKTSLRSKLKVFCVKEEMTVKEIKDEMELTLGWLVPVATNTAKAHHGFGWVGEWANTGSDGNPKAAIQTEIMRIETLHHADKEKTESCILDMLLWLHHLASKSKSINTEVNKSPFKSTSNPKANQEVKDLQTNAKSVVLTPEDHAILQAITKKRRSPGISKSQDFDAEKTCLKKRSSLTRSSSYSPRRESSKEPLPFNRLSSGVRVLDLVFEKKKVLDMIDRVEIHR
ncbi:protein PSK SIMULATOR 1-like [Humulus lupulus]|uniref:protein PSK SIMULATOR 1-like n=1 Tax=Humulus lupulus TaxID=3486 RepID=UPI002B404522|nr:protein PSK SIMULATOR 1-like [Humulus lupulus]